MNTEIEKKKTNIIVSLFQAIIYIFLYALIGVKFVFIDVWLILFGKLFYGLNKNHTVEKKTEVDEKKAQNDLYDRIKNSKKKKMRTYHYTAAALAKYDRMKMELANDLQASGAIRTKEANVYKCTLKDKHGKIFTDTMSGFSKLDINSFLVNEGYEVIDIRTSKMINFLYKDSALFGSKIKTKDLVFWITQLSTYLRSGITLNDAVRILSMQLKKNKAHQKVYKSISYELTLGESFSVALEKQGNFFPPLLINMIKAAEASGTLQETLDDMANYYTDVNNTQKEMKSALTYPAIITVFAISVVTFIIVYVVPQFTKIYAQSDIEITGLTAVVIKLSDFLQHNLITVIGIIVLIMGTLYFLYIKVNSFRIMAQILFMKLPVIKDVIIYKELTIFAKTFASLLKNNVFITESMDILSKITTNEVYKAIMFRTINNIVNGENISEAFKDHWAVPDVAYYMIVTGESTGQLAEMMKKVSDYYQVMHKSIVNSLKSLIEPIMIIFLAVIVGGVILAVIVPMFQLYNNIL